MKNNWLFAKNLFALLWNEGPKIYFWWGMLGLNSLFLKFKNPYLYWPSAIIASISLLIILIKVFLSIKSDINKAQITKATKSIVIKEDPVKTLIEGLPSDNALKIIYSFAQDYAKAWSSDGELKNINYYVDYNGKVLSRRVQIHIYSKNKQELLSKYLPEGSESTEELDFQSSNFENAKLIYDFSEWEKVCKELIEKVSSDIKKADGTDIQISPQINALSFNFYFRKDSHKWIKRFTYSKDGSLGNEN